MKDQREQLLQQHSGFYFNFDQIDPQLIFKHLLTQKAAFDSELFHAEFGSSNLESNKENKPLQLKQNDQLDFLRQLCDYLARAFVMLGSQQQARIDAVQGEKIKAIKKTQDSMSLQLEAQLKKRGVDFKEMANVNTKIVKIQAWFRMLLVKRKLLRNASQTKRALVDPNSQLVKEFHKALQSKKLSPEQFFRAIDTQTQGKIPVETFIESCVEKQLVVNRAQGVRLAFIIDEDVSGDVTLKELQKTLVAYSLPVEQQALLSTPQGTLTYEQDALIRVFEQMKRRSIEPHELFSAIDTDNNMQLTIDELSKFIKALFNNEQKDDTRDQKNLMDKDVRIFLNFMDLDRNSIITKAEFLRQFQKIDVIANKQFILYRQAQTAAKSETLIKSEPPVHENDAKTIVRKMQAEGINLKHFLNHLPSLAEQATNHEPKLIKLGNLLKQFQMSYPTLTLDEIRSFLKWARVNGGRYDAFEVQIFISRLSDDSFDTNNNTLMQTLRVIATLLTSKKCTPDSFIAQAFPGKSVSIAFQEFTQQFWSSFNLPQESIVDLFNALLIESNQAEVVKQDLKIVLESFEGSSDQKITLSNLQSHLNDFDPSVPVGSRLRKEQIARFIMAKLKERKLQLISVFRMSTQDSSGVITRETIAQSFDKLLPLIGRDLVLEVWSKQEGYKTKEEFLAEVANLNSTSDQQVLSKDDLIKKLDEALLEIRASPSLLFREADSDRDGTVSMRELSVTLTKLGIQLDEVLLRNIFNQLDINGNGQLEEKEFYQLFKQSRLQTSQSLQKTSPTFQTSVSRDLLLPTRQNLLKLTRSSAIQPADSSGMNSSFIKYTSEFADIFSEIEVIVPLLDILANVEIDFKMQVDLIELASVLKSKSVPLKSIVKLYQLIDPSFRGSVYLPSLLHLIEQSNKQPILGQVHFNLMCRIINISGCLTVEDFFTKKARFGEPSQSLNREQLQREFAKFFEISGEVSSLIFDRVKTKMEYGMQGVTVRHMFLYLQQQYNQIYPSDQALQNLQQISARPSLQQSQPVQSQQLSGDQLRNETIKNVIIKLFGIESGPVSLTGMFSTTTFVSSGTKSEVLTLQTFVKVLVDQRGLLTLAEAKALFSYLLETSQQTITVNLYNDKIGRLEQQIIAQTIKEITVKLEGAGDEFVDIVVSKVTFVQNGMISKHGLTSALINQYCKPPKAVVDPVHIRFVMNWIDKSNQKVISLEELQGYLKLYTTSKQISTKLYLTYFAYILDAKAPNESTAQVIKIDPNVTATQVLPQKYFAKVILQYFPLLKKEEYLMDLYDYLMQKLTSELSPISGVFSYFLSQIDLLRSLDSSMRFKARSNRDLIKEVVAELKKCKPNYPVYRIMDELPFADETSIIPELALKHHLRKVYPYAEEAKLKLFLTLADINADARIEVQEMFAFLSEIDNGQTSGDKVIANIAQIVVSTGETLEEFLDMHQQAIPNSCMTLVQFLEFILAVFRFSKFEGYLAFKSLNNNQHSIQLQTFKDKINAQIGLAQVKRQQESTENVKAEENIKQFKSQMASKMKSQLKKDMDNDDIGEVGLSNDKGTSARTKNVKLGNIDILKLFLQNYNEICTFDQLKRACLKLQRLIKASPLIRAQLFTRRVCVIQDIYRELGREDPNIAKDMVVEILTESEKVLLAVLPLEKVDMICECNIFHFKRMIARLTPASNLDFQMLLTILQQRYLQIEATLVDELISIETIIQKIKDHSSKAPKMEILIRDGLTVSQLLQILQRVFPSLNFRKSEQKLLTQELGQGRIPFQKTKFFLVQCGLSNIVQQPPLTQIHYTLEQAKTGIDLIRNYLQKYPYLELNTSDEGFRWCFVESFDGTLQNRVSLLHQNQLVLDCLISMNADWKEDQIQRLIVGEDQTHMIVKIDQSFVVIDKQLPFSVTDDQEAPKIVFSFNQSHHKIPYIEKALVTYLGGKYGDLGKIKSTKKMFQLLNIDHLESFSLGQKVPLNEATLRSKFDDLHSNYFLSQCISRFYFRLQEVPIPSAKSNSLLGLDQGRLCSVVSLMSLKNGEKVQPDCLAVVQNLWSEEKRGDKQRWSRGYLKTASNQDVEKIKKQYGQEAFEYLTNPTSNVYVFDFLELFPHVQEIYLQSRLAGALENQAITKHSVSQTATFKLTAPLIYVDKQKQAVHAYLQVILDSDDDKDVRVTLHSQDGTQAVIALNREEHSRLWCKTVTLDPEATEAFAITIESPHGEVEFIVLSKADQQLSVIRVDQEVPKSTTIDVPEQLPPPKSEINENQALADIMAEHDLVKAEKELPKDKEGGNKDILNDAYEEYDDEYEEEEEEEKEAVKKE